MVTRTISGNKIKGDKMKQELYWVTGYDEYGNETELYMSTNLDWCIGYIKTNIKKAVEWEIWKAKEFENEEEKTETERQTEETTES